MEEYQITNSVEWSSVRERLLRSKLNLTMFKNDIHRLMAAIDKEVAKLGNLEVVARNKKNKSSYDYAQAQLDVVNQQIKNFNKFYMMALLSHD